MDQQLMALVVATITLGTAMFGSSRWLRKSVEKTVDKSEKRLTGAINALRAEMKEADAGLHAEIKETDAGVRAEIEKTDAGLRAEIEKTATGLRAEIAAQGQASKERDLALEKSIQAHSQASKERDLALEKSLGAAIRAQGDASKDRDHAIEKRLDDLRDDLRGAPAAHHPAPPAIVAEA